MTKLLLHWTTPSFLLLPHSIIAGKEGESPFTNVGEEGHIAWASW